MFCGAAAISDPGGFRDDIVGSFDGYAALA